MTISPYYRAIFFLVATSCGPSRGMLEGTSDQSTQSTVTNEMPTSGQTLPTSSSTQAETNEADTNELGSSANTVESDFISKVDVSGCISEDSSDRSDCRDCSTFDQNCGDGEKCIPIADRDGDWNGTKCIPITGGSEAGEPCTAQGISGIDNCALGHICWDRDERGNGTCVAFCSGDQSQPVCTDGFACISNSNVLHLCLTSCHPLAQDCTFGSTCTALSSSFVCVPDKSGLDGKPNDSCSNYDECDPGLICFPHVYVSASCNPQDLECCTPFCELPDGPCPAPDQNCSPWYEEGEAPLGEENLGICLIPP